jgi:hypothetical protein
MEEAYRLEGSHEDFASIDRFLDSFTKGKLSDNMRKQIDFDLMQSEQNIELLNETQPLDYMDFNALINDESLDGVIFFHNSSLNSPSQRASSQMFNHLAKYVKQQLKVHNVVFTSYDFARNRLPEDFFNDQEFVPGAVYLVPAGQKRGPFLKWRALGKKRTSADLLRFCAEHVDNKFSPSLPAGELSAEDRKYFGEEAARPEPVNLDL